MASFREARIALLDAYMDGLLDDDEFLVLWQAHKSKNPEFPYEEHGWFSFDELDEAECKAEFRFLAGYILIRAAQGKHISTEYQLTLFSTNFKFILTLVYRLLAFSREDLLTSWAGERDVLTKESKKLIYFYPSYR